MLGSFVMKMNIDVQIQGMRFKPAVFRALKKKPQKGKIVMVEFLNL
jgi:hypothetical protein